MVSALEFLKTLSLGGNKKERAQFEPDPKPIVQNKLMGRLAPLQSKPSFSDH